MRTAYGKIGYLSRFGLRYIKQMNKQSRNIDEVWIHDLKFVITKDLLNKRIVCFTGKKYWSCMITEEHIGFKVGCFMIVKQRVTHMKSLKG